MRTIILTLISGCCLALKPGGNRGCLSMLVCGPMAALGLLSAPLLYRTGGVAASLVALGIAAVPIGLMVQVLQAYFRSR